MPLFLAQEGGSTGSALLIVWVLIFGGFFLFVSMRQRGRVRRRQDFLATLAVGDRVRTIGGIIGVIEDLTDDEAVVVVEGTVRLRVIRQAIAERSGSGEA